MTDQPGLAGEPLPSVDDVYPLTPMQEGILFHVLYAPGSGSYLNQYVFTLRGPVDPDALREAWQRVVDREPVLRTAFAWEGLEKPLQVVRSRAALPWETHDWRGDPPGIRRARLEAFLEAERSRDLDPTRPPLTRVALVRTTDDEWELVWTYHHLLLDGWSISLLLRDVVAEYGAGASHGTHVPPRRRPFRDHVTRLLRQDPARAEAYWRGALEGFARPTPLGVDGGEAREEEGFGAVERRLSLEATAALRAFAQRSRVTSGTLVLGAWAVLLARYSGEEDVVFGATVSGRSPELEGMDEMVGLFINTLPVRARVEGGTRVAEWLAGLQREQHAAREHDHVPLTQVQRWSEVPAGLPLFDSLVVFENHPVREVAEMGGRGFAVEAWRGIGWSHYPVGVTVVPGDRLELTLGFRRGRIEADAAERMLGHLDRLLEVLAEDPERRVAELDLLGQAERGRVLETWGRAETDHPVGDCVHALFEAQAGRTPDAVALVAGAETLTYRELNARANRLAHHLRGLGVGPEARVGVCLPRTPGMLISLLAVLKAGGAYVPLDPAYPRERLDFMLEDAGVRLVLTEDALADHLPARAEPVRLDLLGEVLERAPEHDPESGVLPENLSHVIFTSGSTGRPNGVMIRHASVGVLLRWLRENVTDAERAAALFSTSVNFDVSVAEVFGTLCWGGTLHLAENALSLAEMHDAGIVYASMVPTAAAELLRAGGIPASVRTLSLAGEALPPELARALHDLGTVERVGNLYGPTEDTTYSTCAWVPRGCERVRIGRPLSNTRAYVLDGELRPLPAGVAGELYLAGDGLARGYAARPDRTAERFLPDPFGEPGSRMYRVMDRARWTADGELEYLGRTDHQVKVRGFRVELGEVEAALLRHSSVRSAVATVREDVPGERRLVAYVVPEGAPPGAAGLRAHLRESLPEYMVPGAFVVLDALPVTPNGKLDRGALPAPENAQADARYLAPRTPVEEVLAGIWAEVLRRERVGVRDRFFELGGHSLLAIRVVSRIREVLGVEPPLRVVFEASTVAELAERVEALRRAAPPVLPPVVPVERAGPLPLSFAQERLWFLDRLEPDSPFYNIPSSLRLGGDLDVLALERAFGEVVRRHEALRTRFTLVAGAPVQLVEPFEGFVLPVEEVHSAGEAERAAEVRRRAMEEAESPFDLASGPLLRAKLLRLGAAEHVLLVSLHHIVGDAWSMDTLFRELAALYTAYRAGGASPLPELAVQYADYAVWQRRVLGGAALDGQLAYWRGRLAGAPALLELPTDRPRPAVQEYRGARARAAYAGELRERLQALGRSEGATPFMVLVGAFQVLLSRYAATDDVSVGTPITGRSRKEVEPLIGLFLNTLVLRTDLGGEPGFRDVLRRVRGTTLEAYENRELPFERLVEELQPERSLGHSPLFQVMFVLDDPDGGVDGLPGLDVRELGTESGTSKFDLTLTLTPHPGGLTGTLEYRTDLFERATAERMLAHFGRVLEQVAADAEVRLPALDLLGEGERRQVLETWNRTEAEYPSGLCAHALFEAQADRTPDAVAVASGGASLTYREMDERANRLAHHLAALGVGPDARVAMCLERGPEALAGLLGILKAGGAYVPLDPAYPAERLAYMLEDSGARVLLTSRGMAGQLPSAEGVRVVRVDEDEAEIAGRSAARPRVPVTPDHLAYVVYTSGSTGRPKGVAMPHRPLVNLLTWQAGDWRAPASPATLQFAPVSFDVSFQEVFSCWAAGGRVVTMEDALRYDPAALLELLEREGVERLFLPAVALRHLAEEADARGRVPSRLREVVTAGEQLRVTGPVRRWMGATGAVLHNQYGPSETHVVTALALEGDPSAWAPLPGIGGPVSNTRCYVLDTALRPVPVGVPGELYLGGVCLARGYLGRPDLTAERFVPDPFGGGAGERLYRTGDRVRRLGDGGLEFLGRVDAQVKLRGFRIEPGEIEAALEARPQVREAVAVVREDAPGDRRLVAYVVAEDGASVDPDALRAHLKERLPEYMVPAAVVALDALPLTPSGKVARRGLPVPEYAPAEAAYVAPRVPLEQALAGIWGEVLHLERVGVHANFFDLGGHSLTLAKVQARIRETLGREVPVVDLFRFPTVASLAHHLASGTAAPAPAPRRRRKPAGGHGAGPAGAVAIVGMAGRFPGAPDVEAFWGNLRGGVHSVVRLDDEALAAAGTDPALQRDPAFVRVGGVLEGIDLFDAGFFGFNPREAEVLDPQHRLFLETAWEALENAGYGPGSVEVPVGVYAGSSASRYLTHHVLPHPGVVDAVGALQVEIGNGKDFLASRAAYKLNLRGPALNVQTACSTGLVAVHVAARALAAGECDLAVAGGVGVRLHGGYLYTPSGILSPDGVCRAFDARASGTVVGSGVGLVVLKRLADALADGDTIRAVVRGTAINNDGAQKVGYTAPSVQGQAEVVADALAAAGVDPESVGFVEAHGSGTELGDPVEVAALTQAYGDTERKQFCALGSVKTNVGHLDGAAGIAGLIKAVLALEHGEIPPTLHFTEPNPRIDFAASPFFVNPELRPWTRDGAAPRRAGVSSFGIGGTNAHAVLEEAPPQRPSVSGRAWHLLPLSARTPAALEAATDRLAAHLRAHPEQELADVAYTLQVGRRAFEHRRVLVARDPADAARALEARAPDRLPGATAPESGQRVAFLFPGLGNQHPGMGRGVYETEPVYRETVDRCAEILRPHLGMDLRDVLYPPETREEGEAPSGGIDLRGMLGRAGHDEDEDPLHSTLLAQTALFVTEYALARLWMHWGVRPEAMIGHSLGEYVAATVAGVFSLEDALMLVAERARLIDETPEGGMMGITLTEEEVVPLLRDGVSIGAKNATTICVVSGPVAAVDALQAEMAVRGVFTRRLPARRAFHSPLMEPVAGRLAELLRRVRLHPPKIPFASNVTGTWITAEEATDPEYWTRHLVGMVRFSENVEALAGEDFRLLLEVGAGNTIGFLTLQLPVWGEQPPSLVVSLPHRFERSPDDAHLLGAAGRMWAAGAPVDWNAVHAHERLRRVPLPTYPFERGRYWLEPGAAAGLPEARGSAPGTRRPDPADWTYLPAWTRAPLAAQPPVEPAEWLVLADGAGIGGRLAGRLESLGHTVVVAEAGDRFARVGDRGYTVRPGSAEDLAALRATLHAEGTRPRGIVHLWGIDPEGAAGAHAFGRAQARGYATVAGLARTFAADASGGPVRLVVVTEGVRDVYGGEEVHPGRATVLGACLALPHEHPHVACRTVDVRTGAGGDERLVDQLLDELLADVPDPAVALRGPWRWTLGYEAMRPREDAAGLRAGGAYLFSGSMAGGADVLAEHLAGAPGTRIAVVVAPGFPEREAWDAVLASPSGGGADAPTLRGIRAAEASGARTLLLRASPDDAPAMRAAVAEAHEAFGALHGVVHAAGLGAGAAPSPLADAHPGAAAEELARVARELAALEEATAGIPLDFCLLQNSIFSVFGGAGLATATAAFVLLDTWAQRRTAAGGGRWTSVSWDRWIHGDDASGGAHAERAILPGDGPRAFECVAALAGEPRVVVSTHDLRSRLDRLRAPRAAPTVSDGATEPALHARPALGNEYLVPTSEAEEILVGIWGELLGIREIGIRDSFFDLGGHSLLGVQVLARVREVFQVELPLRAVFEAPTIAELAGLIDEAILRELDAMSDEEALSAMAGVDGLAGYDSTPGA